MGLELEREGVGAEDTFINVLGVGDEGGVGGCEEGLEGRVWVVWTC